MATQASEINDFSNVELRVSYWRFPTQSEKDEAEKNNKPAPRPMDCSKDEADYVDIDGEGLPRSIASALISAGYFKHLTGSGNLVYRKRLNSRQRSWTKAPLSDILGAEV